MSRRHQQQLLLHNLTALNVTKGGVVREVKHKQFSEVTSSMLLRIQNGASNLDRMYVLHLIDRMDKILNKYRCCKERRGEGVWIYYKRIPCRYWHEMMEAYDVFRDVLGHDGGGGIHNRFGRGHIRFNHDDKMKMDLYVRLLPALGHFDKCRAVGGTEFGLCRRIVYDHMPCLVD